MHNAISNVPKPVNETIKTYQAGSQDRAALVSTLDKLYGSEIEIPLIIGGEEIRTGNTRPCICPHEHNHVLGHYHLAGQTEIARAIDSAREAWCKWSEWDWSSRAAVFLKAAELISGRYRNVINAATMLNQSKNIYQAEIDAACESIDFFRFNTYYMSEIYREQPYSSQEIWNVCDYRALEGFVFAVSPFNFTSIGANLPSSPAIMGNVVLWKPASSAVYSAYQIMKVFMEAGVPPGVINFIPGSGSQVGDVLLRDSGFAGIHFTGSVRTFNSIWQTIGRNIDRYRAYPRIVGETGGKDFVFVHASADPLEVVTALTEGSFGYQGQKCSAASRAYIPDSLWPQIRDHLIENIKAIKVGDVRDFGAFMNAVIDAGAFKSITDYIEYARSASDAEILCGGGYDDSVGYFIEPTLVLTSNPKFKLMEEEIFGPVLTVYVYPEKRYRETLELCNETSPFGLTGSIFARDRCAITRAYKTLRHAAGNFYINDKPTGAVVGQQPFGGGRKSGTNDKAGSKVNLMRWVNIRTIKENLVPPTEWRYTFMEES
jgi:1-pyrroline-5-carboxylate dehydrogenase